jgi:hypothetical protein
MSDKLPTLNAALIKVVGVFSFNKKDIHTFNQMGYEHLPIMARDEIDAKKIEKDNTYIRDYYYAEFAELFFSNEKNEKSTSTPKYLKKEFQFDFIKKTFDGDKLIPATVTNPEIYFFKNNSTGIFSLTFKLIEKDFNYLSDITFCASSFDVEVNENNTKMAFHEWISTNVLGGIKLRGKKIETDKFSGSKFKVYSIIDVLEKEEDSYYNRDFLLFDIGTRSKIGSIGYNGYFAPSKQYYDELMQDSISAFNNYKGLALLDSFTIIGNNLYPAEVKDERDLMTQNTFNRIYFSIYIFNLFVRYNLFKFNATYKSEPKEKRDEFQQFLSDYNFKHISFNFLPNIFFNKMRNAMGIDNEIEHFESRLDSLATKIQEDQDKRQAMLLGVISALSSISAIEPIISILDNFQKSSGISISVFYSFFSLLVVSLALGVLAFLFPRLYKKIVNNIKNKTSKNVQA